jgi:hypothetical protein
MHILPGLTSTKKERIPAFIEALGESEVRAIALFPTVLDRDERSALYRQLESIENLMIPHVHVTAGFDESEFEYLDERFGTEAFNTHPRLSPHPFPDVPARYADRVFVENVVVPPEDEEIEACGGICPDYAHLESARCFGMLEYVDRFKTQLLRYKIGCCHVSAIRPGDPNAHYGSWDHHQFKTLADLDYLANYRDVLPSRWMSLELENTLSEQLEAITYLAKMFEMDLKPLRKNERM